MEDVQRIVKCGSLSLHTPGGFFKRRWHTKYLVLYDGSKSGVKRLELFDSEIKFKKQSPVKIIPLVDCVRIVTCQRHKTTFTFEVRTIDQFYLLASKSFQDMNDWVNCLRLVAFGQTQPVATSGAVSASAALNKRPAQREGPTAATVDVLLERRAQAQAIAAPLTSSATATTTTAPSERQALTASQAAASALAKTRQRQPSLLGSCKPQPPSDSPFLKQQQIMSPLVEDAPTTATGEQQLAQALQASDSASLAPHQMDTLTPTVRGQLIASAAAAAVAVAVAPVAPAGQSLGPLTTSGQRGRSAAVQIQATLDEEEENMLYCSIEDNPIEHNYRVKVIETELALRCQLKCYQLTASKTVSQQYEELSHFRHNNRDPKGPRERHDQLAPIVTFYQLIIGPQEISLLNDYAASYSALARSKQQQQGLWSWPYQCIRRYGFDKDNCFMFEAGRKCTSGPGQFIVQTPKAYNIYQDVVKFVNELRTISDSTPAASSTAAHSNGDLVKQAVVTQIPVTWTPARQSELAATATIQSGPLVDSREQFFQTLRQIDAPEAATSSTVDHPIEEEQPSGTGRGGDGRASAAPAKQVEAKQVNGPQNERTSAPKLTSHDFGEQGSGRVATSVSSRDSPGRKASAAQRLPNATKANSVTSEESGYEQGDESVESSVNAQPKSPSTTTSSATSRLLGGLNKRPAAAYSSAASSTSLSPSSSAVSSAGNSPGHSVSRRTGESMQSNNETASAETRDDRNTDEADRAVCQYLVNTRLALSKVCPPETGKSEVKTTETAGKLSIHNLITDGVLGTGDNRTGQPDFETSLIRDVYSEITKLHAKFAVTSTSSQGDDSMSSDSRESSGATSDRDPLIESHEEEDDDDDDEAEEEEDPDGGCYYMNEEPASDDDQREEPMYSNLMAVGKANQSQQSHGRQVPVDVRNKQSYLNGNNNNNHHPHIRHHQFGNENLINPAPLSLQPRPIYPSVLKPIPEINENSQSTPQKRPTANRLMSQIVTQDLESLPRSRSAVSREAIRRNTAGSGQNDTKIDKSKPTNHYVINDVQYAKISRNMSAKFR